jgi:hypothetical protein
VCIAFKVLTPVNLEIRAPSHPGDIHLFTIVLAKFVIIAALRTINLKAFDALT